MTIEVAIAAVGLGRRLRADPRVVAIFVAFEIAHDISFRARSAFATQISPALGIYVVDACLKQRQRVSA